MGAMRLESAEPCSSSPRWQISVTAHWTFNWGPMWDGKRSTYVEVQHQLPIGWPNVNGGHATAPRQLTGIDDFITHCFLTGGLSGCH
jgi:hypothetical protein